MSFDLEKLSTFTGLYIGCDEVGRGPLAGPVVGCAAGACDFETHLSQLSTLKITDSKKLNHKKRQEILNELEIDITRLKAGEIYTLKNGIKFTLNEFDNDIIDEINILNASLESMCQSALAITAQFSKMKNLQKICLIDGNKVFKRDDLPFNMEAVVKGDQKSLAIALASIIAKEYRDFKMELYDRQFPEYGFAGHSGYPTKKHREAIAKYGVTSIHRKTFKGVREYL